MASVLQPINETAGILQMPVFTFKTIRRRRVLAGLPEEVEGIDSDDV